MTTDIRAEAAAAARDYEKREVDAHPYMEPRFLHTEPWGKTFEIAYMRGHAAGFTAGARAFAEFIDANYTGVECFQTEDDTCDGVVAVTDAISVLARFLAAPGTGLASSEGKEEED